MNDFYLFRVRELKIGRYLETENGLYFKLPDGGLRAVTWFFDKKEYCVEQSTGLRDVNNKLIFAGGNHFISVEKDEKTGDNWLIIHTGSRKFGKDICEYYQKLAIRKWSSDQKDKLKDIPPVERQKWILVEKEKKPSNELCYLMGEDRENYLRNMNVAQRFARTNHREIFNQIVAAMDYLEGDCIYTSHNYIDLEDRIIRKGAVCAKKNQRFLIPLNMKDGTLICIGKGNKEWNCSAPHGAGRLMSRKQAFEELSFGEYQRQMQGVYSTCIRPETLDESPMAYKPFDEIIECIKPTAKVVSHLKPIYNFKATE